MAKIELSVNELALLDMLLKGKKPQRYQTTLLNNLTIKIENNLQLEVAAVKM